MKLLLDENLPVKLKYRFIEKGFDTFTIKDMAWLGKQNGMLLREMQHYKFDVFVTIDNNLSFQQNFTNYPIQVLVLISPDNTYSTIILFIDKIISALEIRWLGAKAVELK